MRQITINLTLSDPTMVQEDFDIVININGKKYSESMAGPVTPLIPPPAEEAEQPTSVFRFMEGQVKALRQKGRVRSSETYGSTLNSFRRFRKNQDLLFREINGDMLENYQAWLKAGNVKLNTVAFYMRILRACYRKAVSLKLTSDRMPFGTVCTTPSKTLKRAVSISMIQAIYHFRATDPHLLFARDMFLFSFFMRGMSFIDMAFLKKSDLHNGIITYSRRKTGQTISVKWTSELQKIIDRHPSKSSMYLLPIISKANGKERNQMRHHQYCINNSLGKLSETLHTEQKITMYVARHSWASAARELGIPLPVISSAMGHDSEKTTYIYLKELSASTIDNANQTVIDNVIRHCEEE